MTLMYSMAHHPGRDGPSRPLTWILEAINTKYGPEAKVISAGDIPHLSDTGRLGDGIGPAYDELALEEITHGEVRDPNLFLGTGGSSLRQMDWLLQEPGTRVGTLWFSSHCEYAQRVLSEEYPKYGDNRVPIHPYLRWRTRKEQAISDFIIVPSEFCKETYPEDVKQKAHVAEFGVDSTLYKPNPDLNGQGGDVLRMIFPGTNPARKGLGYLLEALSQFKGKFNLNCTGTRIPLQGQSPHIQSHGWVSNEDMLRFYQSSDVYVSASVEEGQALAALESAACGLPLIVTPNTGIPIEDGKQGFVVPARDSKALLAKLEYLRDNESERKRMGAEARAWAEQRSWSNFQTRIIEILEQEANA